MQGHAGSCGVMQDHAGSYRIMQGHAGTCRDVKGHAGTYKDTLRQTEMCTSEGLCIIVFKESGFRVANDIDLGIQYYILLMHSLSLNFHYQPFQIRS